MPVKALLLAGAIWIPSLPLLARYLPLPLVALHSALVFAGVTLLLHVRPNLSPGVDRAIAAGLWGILVVGFAWIYPIADSGRFGGGSDRDDALERGTTSLLEGRYPYYERTSLGKDLSPLPGSLLLALPFALANAVPLQSLLWLGAFALVLAARGQAAPTLALLTIGSPAVLHDVVTGGDLVANSLYVLAAVGAVAGASGRLRWAAYLFCGIAFSSRPSFWLALLPLAAHLHARGRPAREASVAVLLVLAAVTLPFYLWDPLAFTPLHVFGKLAGARSLFPGGDWALVAAAGLLVLAATRRVDGRVESLLEVQCFALWLPPALTSAAMWLIADYRWAEFLYFALPAGFWAVVRIRSERAS